jgi:hypothetical protein
MGLEGPPIRQPHKYLPNGTANLLTLFHPATGQVRVKGVTSSANAVLIPGISHYNRGAIHDDGNLDVTLCAARNRRFVPHLTYYFSTRLIGSSENHRHGIVYREPCISVEFSPIDPACDLCPF